MMLPGFEDIPIVQVESKRKPQQFIYCYCELTGIMRYYWYRGHDNRPSHYELIDYGTSRKLPKRLRNLKAIHEHLEIIQGFDRWSRYRFKIALFNDFHKIGKASQNG